MSFNGPYLHTVDTKGKLQSSIEATDSADLTTKGYVDSAIQAGGGDWEASVLSILSTQPSDPGATDTDRHLLGATPSGAAWTGHGNAIAAWNGSSWDFTPETGSAGPTEGTHVWVEGGGTNSDSMMLWNSTQWVVVYNANGALIKTNNLSDLGDAGTARTNLGLGSLATSSSVNLGTDVSGVLGTASGGTGASSSPMIGLITAVDAAAARTAIGVGSISTQASSNVSITGGTVTGITDLAIADGGTGAGTATAAFDALSPMTAAGDVIVGDTSGANARLAVGTAGQVLAVKSGATELEWIDSGGSGTVQSVGTDADSGTGGAITASGTIKVVGGTGITTSVTGLNITVNGDDATTGAKGIAKFSSDNFTVTTGEVTIKTGGVDLTTEVTGTLPAGNGGTGLTSTSTLLNSNVTPTSLSLVIGTNTQAWDADLDTIAGLAKADGNFIVGNGTAWVVEGPSTVRTSLGLGTAAQKAVATSINGGDIPTIGTGTIVPSAAIGLDSSGLVVAASISSTDVSGLGTLATQSGTYGEFTSPIKRDLDYSAPTSAQSLAPTDIDSAYEEYVIDMSGQTTGDTFTLPVPAATDKGKSITIKVLGGMSATNKLTVSINNANDKMDGFTSLDLDQGYQRLTFTAIQAGTNAGINVYSLG